MIIKTTRMIWWLSKPQKWFIIKIIFYHLDADNLQAGDVDDDDDDDVRSDLNLFHYRFD